MSEDFLRKVSLKLFFILRKYLLRDNLIIIFITTTKRNLLNYFWYIQIKHKLILLKLIFLKVIILKDFFQK